MTPAATIATDIRTAEFTQIKDQNCGTRIVQRTDIAGRIGIGFEAHGDRLVPARGALLGITVGAVLWALLLILIMLHYMGAG